MRRVSAVIGIVTIMCCAIPLCATAVPQLSFTPVSATPGDTVEMELLVTGATDPYRGVNVKFTLPEGVSVASVGRRALLSSEFVVDSHSFVEDGVNVQTALACSITDSINPEDGALLRFVLNVASEPADVGLKGLDLIQADIAFLDSGMVDYDCVTALEHTAQDGVFTITREPVPALVVSPAVCSVPQTQGTTSLRVINAGETGLAWTASVGEGADWLSIASGASGMDTGAIELAYTANPSVTTRSGTVVVDAGDAPGSPFTVTVIQGSDFASSLEVSPTAASVSSTGGAMDLEVLNAGTGTLDWSARVLAGAGWLRVTGGASGTDGGVVSLACGPNDTPAPRTGYVEVIAQEEAGESSVLVVVVQSPPTVLSVFPREQAVAPEGCPLLFMVSNAGEGVLAWSAEVTSGDEWLTLTQGATGSGSGSIAALCARSLQQEARVGTVRVEAPGALGSPAILTITQAGDTVPLLAVTPSEQTVNADATTAEFNVTNVGYGTLQWLATVAEGGDWVSISAGASGTGEGPIRLSFSENNSADDRTALVRVEADGANGSPAEVALTQRGRKPLEIICPNGGENWKRGAAQTIEWASTAAKNVEAVTIILLKGGNVVNTIALTTDNTGLYEWTIPPETLPDDDYRIQIIDVSNAAVHDESDVHFGISCPPDAPANVSASDGGPGAVVVTWEAVDSAIEYEVYRNKTDDVESATLVGSTDGLRFEDITAAPPKKSGFGCFAQAIPEYYLYWVKAVNPCNASAFSLPDQGHRGSESNWKASVYEPVLPVASIDGEYQRVQPDGVLCIRLRSEGVIDEASVWGSVTWSDSHNGQVGWLSIATNDGWVVHRPDASWQIGDLIEMTVGGATTLGEELGPITYTFEVTNGGIDELDASKELAAVRQPDYADFDTGGLDLAAESNDIAWVAAMDSATPPHKPVGAVGQLSVIGPDQAFQTPQRVWLPVPSEVDPSAVSIWYYHASDAAAGWYPGENVEGWLVPDSALILELDGTTYLGFLARHAAIVQLRLLDETLDAEMAAASAVPTTISRDNAGDVLVLAATALVLFIATRFSPRGRRRKLRAPRTRPQA